MSMIPIEERIIQTGKKKLVLDHLIVQKMDDDDDSEDVKSILMFGAQALFQEGDDHSARAIHCKYRLLLSGILLFTVCQQTLNTTSIVSSRRQRRKVISRNPKLEKMRLSPLPKFGLRTKTLWRRSMMAICRLRKTLGLKRWRRSRRRKTKSVPWRSQAVVSVERLLLSSPRYESHMRCSRLLI